MLDFLKRFGLGILYTILSPFLAAFFLLWFLNNLIVFFVELFKGIISFFSGKTFFPIIKEDQEAKIILSTLDDQIKINNTPPQQNTQTTNQTININLAPGMNPNDVLSSLNKNNPINQNNQLPKEDIKEIDTNTTKEIEINTTDDKNGGNL